MPRRTSTAPVAIYVLLNPVSGKPRYVGLTNAPKRRLWEHINSAKRGLQRPCAMWVLSLLRSGQEPQMRVLEWCEIEQAPSREVRWVRRLFERGFDLANATPGGDPPFYGAANPNSLLSETKVLRIWREVADGAYGADLAREMGVEETAVYTVLKGQTWTHVRVPEDVQSRAREVLASHRRGEGLRRSRLCETAVREIVRRRAAGEKLKSIASDFGVSQGLVTMVMGGEVWGHIDVPGRGKLATNRSRKMTPDGVREMRRLATQGMNYSELGRLFSVSPVAARHIVLRNFWKHVE